MLTAKAQLRFLLVLALAAVLLSFFIIQPYLPALFLAVIFVIAFLPAHRFIRRILGGRHNPSAMISTLLVLLIIFIPLTLFGFLLFQETLSLYEGGVSETAVADIVENATLSLENKISEFFPTAEINIRQYTDIDEAIAQVPATVVNYFDKIFASILRIGVGLLLMILGMFYLFRDGGKLMERIRKISPLKKEYTNTIFSKTVETVNAVIRGRLLVGIILGFFIGTGFALFALPGPVFWGSIAAIASMLPLLGPMLIIIPASLILFSMGSAWSAIGILAWGIIAVIVEEYLGAILINQRMNIHPYLVLLSVIGGMSFFGPVGFVVGPVVLALLFAILEIYPLLTKPDAYET
ncbi:MAG: AI-2E family transporter [Patescibacteria group bacterium]